MIGGFRILRVFKVIIKVIKILKVFRDLKVKTNTHNRVWAILLKNGDLCQFSLLLGKKMMMGMQKKTFFFEDVNLIVVYLHHDYST